MSLWIDDRAGSIDLMCHEPLLSTAEICRLDSGDAMILGNGPEGPLLVGVEVKSIYDLISSMQTGRLQATQLPALIATYDVRWLLVYGSYGPGPGGMLNIYGKSTTKRFHLGRRPVPFGYVEAFLCDVSAVGVRVKNVTSAYAAAQWLGVLHRWWSKPWSKHKGLRAFDRSGAISLIPGMDSQVHFRACVASQLPGVGYERAVAAALHFPSIEAMVAATVADWQSVPGIGKVVANAIYQAVRENQHERTTRSSPAANQGAIRNGGGQQVS